MKNAYFWNIPCLFDYKTSRLIGRNHFYDFLLRIALKVHSFLTFVTATICVAFNIDYEGFFPVYIEEEEV